MKKHAGTIILVLIFVIGLSVMLYPTVSNFINQRNQSKAVSAYKETVSQMTEEDMSSYFQAAYDYNAALASLDGGFYDPSDAGDYENTLNVGNGVMGYITIEKLNVELPIYHGTDETVLEVAAGHLKGTSLPVGGTSTHAVISAHRGLPSAKLFTDIDKLEEGDIFTITILDQLLTYEVDKISIVLPDEVEDLQIVEGEDLCTLMTCTPYGINTHRLLVRGHRVENADTTNIHVTADAVRIEPYIVASIMAVPILLLLFLGLLFRNKRRKNEK